MVNYNDISLQNKNTTLTFLLEVDSCTFNLAREYMTREEIIDGFRRADVPVEAIRKALRGDPSYEELEAISHCDKESGLGESFHQRVDLMFLAVKAGIRRAEMFRQMHPIKPQKPDLDENDQPHLLARRVRNLSHAIVPC